MRETIPSNTTGRFDCLVQAEDPAPRQFVNLKRIPTLLITTESSFHAQYDWCTVQFLRQAGSRRIIWNWRRWGFEAMPIW